TPEVAAPRLLSATTLMVPELMTMPPVRLLLLPPRTMTEPKLPLERVPAPEMGPFQTRGLTRSALESVAPAAPMLRGRAVVKPAVVRSVEALLSVTPEVAAPRLASAETLTVPPLTTKPPVKVL